MDINKMVVKVPASVGNVGSGFDCSGLSLNVFNEFIVEKNIKNSFILSNKVSQESETKTGEFFMYAFNLGLKFLGKTPFNVKVEMLNRIPFRRGFGSSGTIILGALISAFKLSGHQIKKDTLLKLAVEIETHIDNLAASLYGGFVFGFSEKDKIVTYKISPPKDMRVVAYIPEFELSTSDARNVLPSKVPLSDAVYNLCSFGFLCTAFSSGNLELLKYGTRDKLHQTYRGELMGYLEKLTRLNSKNLLGACLSGAGPSVIFFTQKKMQESAVKEVEDKIKEDQLKGEVKLFATGGKTVWKVLT